MARLIGKLYFRNGSNILGELWNGRKSKETGKGFYEMLPWAWTEFPHNI